jgi:hypothetical protein
MDWKARIERAKKSGKFTAKDRELAGSFTSCALSERIPRLQETEKETGFVTNVIQKAAYSDADAEDLEYLGLDFYGAVYDDDPLRAETIYNQMHKIPVKRQRKRAAK